MSSVCNGLSSSLSKMKIETTVFFATSQKRKIERINDYLNVVSLPQVDFPPRSIWFHLRHFVKIVKSLNNFDLIHAISPELAIGYTFVPPRLRRPLVTTLHGSNRAALNAFIQSPIREWVLSDFAQHVLELPIHEIMNRRCFAKSNKTIVCSLTTLKELGMYEGFDTSKISVIYNGVNFQEILDADPIADSEKRTGNEEVSIIYAGRLFWMKGIIYLLKAYGRLRSQFKNTRLKIFGKGPMQNEVKKFILNKGMKGEVDFGGFLPHRKLISEIKSADLVVLPSLYESQPMFALEAMACKKPLIAFDLPYAREIINDNQTGLLSEVCNVNDLTNKIASLLQDQSLRLKLGQNAYEYVKKNHDWDIQAKKYVKIYEKVIDEAGSNF